MIRHVPVGISVTGKIDFMNDGDLWRQDEAESQSHFLLQGFLRCSITHSKEVMPKHAFKDGQDGFKNYLSAKCHTNGELLHNRQRCERSDQKTS
jgi:hypothetical protein